LHLLREEREREREREVKEKKKKRKKIKSVNRRWIIKKKKKKKRGKYGCIASRKKRTLLLWCGWTTVSKSMDETSDSSSCRRAVVNSNLMLAKSNRYKNQE
jgi:hypothetical protein